MLAYIHAFINDYQTCETGTPRKWAVLAPLGAELEPVKATSANCVELTVNRDSKYSAIFG